MIKLMVDDRNAVMGGMDDRYCIDNGAMIAYAGLLEYESSGVGTAFNDTFITQRFRTDEVLIKWRS
jgi:N6-L-threonylcarbamoyladenine synthase